jgi:alpha-tubulin suppressor-like RCC1 family protein
VGGSMRGVWLCLCLAACGGRPENPFHGVPHRMAAGLNQLCVIDVRGQVRCLLSNGGESLEGPATGATTIAAGGDYTCAVADGKPFCWGSSGASIFEPSDFPRRGDVIDVAVGQDHACILYDNGQVMCWGHNSCGQLGNGTLDDRGINDVLNLEPAIHIAAGGDTTCAVLEDGTARCWGNNTDGQLGDGSAAPHGSCARSDAFDCSTVPVQVLGLQGVKRLSLASGFANATSTACAVTITGKVYCWGRNGLNTASPDDRLVLRAPVLRADVTDAIDVSVNLLHACAATVGGAVLCWGANPDGEVADPPSTAVPDAVQVSGVTNAIEVSLGLDYSCALLDFDNTQCWGSFF